MYWDPQHKTVLLKEGVLEQEGDAYGYFNDTLSSTGWSVLEIRAGYGTTPETDEVIFFLAGYLEGFLTAQYVESQLLLMGVMISKILNWPQLSKTGQKNRSGESLRHTFRNFRFLLLYFCLFEADDGSSYQHVSTVDPWLKDPRPGS